MEQKEEEEGTLEKSDGSDFRDKSKDQVISLLTPGERKFLPLDELIY